MKLTNLLNPSFIVPWVAHKFSNVRAIRGLIGMPRNLLLIGFKGAGTMPLDSIQSINSKEDATALLGEGMLLDMFKAAFRNAGLGLPIHVIALSDAALNAATGKLVVSTSTVQAGTLHLWIGGVPIPVQIATAANDTDVAIAIAAAINANPAARVTAVADKADVNLTADIKGLVGNDIDMRVNYFEDQRTPNGLTLTITPMSGGSGAPNLTPLITAMQGQRFTEIVMPFTDSASMALLEAELTARWNEDNSQDGQVVTAVRGTEGELSTWLASRNHQCVHTVTTTKDLTNPWELAAMVGAVVEASSAKDPALPYSSIALNGYYPALATDEFLPTQKSILLNAGGSVLTGVEILRMVTNFTQNGLGALDKSYRNLNWVKTLSYWRWYCVNQWLTKYRQYKLVANLDEPLPGQRIMTKELAEEIYLQHYDTFVDAGLMQSAEHYKDTLLIEIDETNGKVKAVEQPVLVTQHYQTETTSEFIAGNVGA